MYIRRCYRKKNGKRHAYWALVESQRTERGPRQRVVAYLDDMAEQERLGVEQTAAGQQPDRQARLFDGTSPRWVEYVLWKTLAQCCRQAGLGDEPRKVIGELAQIKLVDVVLPVRGGPSIRRRCVSRPTDHQAILLHRLGLHLPSHLKTDANVVKTFTEKPPWH